MLLVYLLLYFLVFPVRWSTFQSQIPLMREQSTRRNSHPSPYRYKNVTGSLAFLHRMLQHKCLEQRLDFILPSTISQSCLWQTEMLRFTWPRRIIFLFLLKRLSNWTKQMLYLHLNQCINVYLVKAWDNFVVEAIWKQEQLDRQHGEKFEVE